VFEEFETSLIYAYFGASRLLVAMLAASANRALFDEISLKPNTSAGLRARFITLSLRTSFIAIIRNMAQKPAGTEFQRAFRFSNAAQIRNQTHPQRA
jgi:hypothetical protein